MSILDSHSQGLSVNEYDSVILLTVDSLRFDALSCINKEAKKYVTSIALLIRVFFFNEFSHG